MNPIALEIGPLTIRWYALFTMIGIAVGVSLAMVLAKKFNIKREDLIDGITYGIPVGIVGARVYYVIFEWERYMHNPIDALKMYEGGGAIHGSIIAAGLFTIWFANKKKMPTLRVVDTVAVGFIIAQAIGRWGNFVNQEAHGPATTLEFLQNLHLPQFVIDGMNINGVYYHPTFLYESVWNLIGFAIIMLFIYKFNSKPGSPALLYLIWYSIGRYMIEALRTDSLMIGPFKMAQLISIFFIAFSAIIWILKNKYLIKESRLIEE